MVETLRHAHALTAGHDFNHAFESVGVRVRVDVVTLAVVAVADDFQVVPLRLDDDGDGIRHAFG